MKAQGLVRWLWQGLVVRGVYLEQDPTASPAAPQPPAAWKGGRAPAPTAKLPPVQTFRVAVANAS